MSILCPVFHFAVTLKKGDERKEWECEVEAYQLKEAYTQMHEHREASHPGWHLVGCVSSRINSRRV